MDHMPHYKEVHNFGSCIERICIQLNSYNTMNFEKFVMSSVLLRIFVMTGIN